MATVKKISELPEATSVTTDDLIQIVDDPSGTPTSKKITWTNVLSFIASATQTLTNKTISGASNTISNIVATTSLTATGTKDSTTFLRGDDTWAVPAGGGGGSFVIKSKINGEIYTGNLGYEIMTDIENGKTIKEIRIGVLGLPTGQNIKVDIRKNGNATTDSIFTSDVPIEISTAESAVNGVYQSGVDTSGTTIGTPGTTLDAGRTGLLSDDVISVWLSQAGTPITGADITIKIVYD